jgi:hypothetical protein
MALEIVDTPWARTLHGLSLRHDPAKSYGQELLSLLDRIWPVVKGRGIANTGINHVVYGQDGMVFAGIELTVPAPADLGLIARAIAMPRHAHWRHVGPYSGLGAANAAARAALAAAGLAQRGPMIEVYGHWDADETKVVTDLLYAL